MTLKIHILALSILTPLFSHSGLPEAEKWIANEFQPSTLTHAQQVSEMKWFIDAAKPFQGMEIRVVSELIDTHVYESSVLAKAFQEITGIKIIHEITGEDDVVKKIQAQMENDIYIYDAYINDSDFIGYHSRMNKTIALSDYINGAGKAVTSPTLDLKDFIGISFTTGIDKKIYQLPDQQFANLYWYRADWFERPDLKKKFKLIYGYELNVPVNWSAYEDIAQFFTQHVREIDGQRVYGHMDYGRKDPSLGWRFSDSWFSMAGSGDKGLPNGNPVDDWGIRVEKCRPVGASVARGGDVNGPAAEYAVRKFVEWLNKYAPPQARSMDFNEAGAIPGQGNIAQQIFWYTAFTAGLTKPNLPVMNKDGTPKWRVAPSPHGVYWRKGMKLGYQDTGSWTLLKNVPEKNTMAAWLYAQFVTSKTVSLKKTLVGLTPIRHSDIMSPVMTEVAPKLGGLVEFYRSKARTLWTPTGVNVPDYPTLAPGWWMKLAPAVSGEVTPQKAVDNLAEFMDQQLGLISKTKKMACGPKLNPLKSPEKWLNNKSAPFAKIENERETPMTVNYETALQVYE